MQTIVLSKPMWHRGKKFVIVCSPIGETTSTPVTTHWSKFGQANYQLDGFSTFTRTGTRVALYCFDDFKILKEQEAFKEKADALEQLVKGLGIGYNDCQNLLSQIKSSVKLGFHIEVKTGQLLAYAEVSEQFDVAPFAFQYWKGLSGAENFSIASRDGYFHPTGDWEFVSRESLPWEKESFKIILDAINKPEEEELEEELEEEVDADSAPDFSGLLAKFGKK